MTDNTGMVLSRSFLSVILGAAAIMLATPSSSAEEGRALLSQQAAETYVARVVAGPRINPIARWRDPICPLVDGLSRDQAELMLQRLSAVAVAVGAPLDAADCKPNLFIVATKDPKTLIRQWVARNDGMFKYSAPADVDRFVAQDRPVRVWIKASTAAQDGRVMVGTSMAFVGLPSSGNHPVLSWAEDSHRAANTARYIAGAAVVLDPRVDKVKLGQLADYIALASFAEVNLDADPPGPSILTLFRQGASRPEALSAGDEAYLKALYAVPPADGNQRAQIARLMTQPPR